MAAPFRPLVPYGEGDRALFFGRDREVQEIADITAVSFDIPMTIAKAVYEPERAWCGDYRGFVGTAGGKPVAIIAMVTTREALGVYSLSTLPEWRNVRRRIPGLSRIAFVNMVARGSAAHSLNWPQGRVQTVAENDGVSAIARQYPYGFHYFQFSPVGFDATGTEAVFHVAYVCSEKCGDGNYVQKQNNQ
jgi:hypothetical protein